MKASFWLAGSRSVVLIRSKPRRNSSPRPFDSQVPNDFFGIGFREWNSPARRGSSSGSNRFTKVDLLTDVPQPIVSTEP
jgi:hypothetical protein